jgi:hypothetical protein
MIRRATAIVATLVLVGAASVCFGAENVQSATRAAEAWLKLVDAGAYRPSYKEASSYFKSRVDENGWVAMVGPVRKPLGAVISRKLKTAQYITSLPGAPDGQYVVIQYDTSFANKKSAVETITPMLDKDGKWRVSGYYIK